MTMVRTTLIAAVCLLLAGCGAAVHPPPAPVDPVTVYLADHGIHASLFLPMSPAISNSAGDELPPPVLVQYAYTQFKWAALDYDQWYRGPFALTIPDDGAIGYREWEGTSDAASLRQMYEQAGIAPAGMKVYPIVTSRASVDRLRAKLDDRWHNSEATKTYNEKRGMWFVKDPAKYSLFHNCNSEVSEWLRDLGCEVKGKAISADYTVSEPK